MVVVVGVGDGGDAGCRDGRALIFLQVVDD